MDNLLVGNVVPPLSSGASLPALLSSVFRPWDSFRNDSDQSFGRSAKSDRLEIGIGDQHHPGIMISFISKW